MAGFTLIEVIIAITVLAIISAIVFPRFARYRAVVSLQGFCDEFSHALKYAKETARAHQGARVQFTRDSAYATSGSYPIGYDYFQVKDTDGNVIKQVSVPEQVTMSGIPMDDYYDINPNGSLENSLEITIHSSATKMMGKININKDTGGIEVKYEENK